MRHLRRHQLLPGVVPVTVGPTYLRMRQVLRKDMLNSRSTGQARQAWPVSDVSRLSGLSEEEIEYSFNNHETHLKKYLLVYDPAARTIHWNG